jgi:hypothetical protein
MIVSGYYYEPMGLALYVLSWALSIAAVVYRDEERRREAPGSRRSREVMAQVFASSPGGVPDVC